MATLTIRKIEPALKERPRRRAARHGRSMESELRHILAQVLAAEDEQEPDLAQAIRRRFAPLGGIDLEPPPLVPLPEPPTWE